MGNSFSYYENDGELFREEVTYSTAPDGITDIYVTSEPVGWYEHCHVCGKQSEKRVQFVSYMFQWYCKDHLPKRYQIDIPMGKP